jgi:diacylglycerol kinase
MAWAKRFIRRRSLEWRCVYLGSGASRSRILKSGGVERALLIVSWMLLIVVEIVNSAIKTIVDRIEKNNTSSQNRPRTWGLAAVFDRACGYGLDTDFVLE